LEDFQKQAATENRKPKIYQASDKTDVSETLIDKDIIDFQRGTNKDKSLEQYIAQEKTKKEYFMNLFLKNDPSSSQNIEYDKIDKNYEEKPKWDKEEYKVG